MAFLRNPFRFGLQAGYPELVVIEPGVPLFDFLYDADTIWVYYPREMFNGGWVCDRMILHRGEVLEARAGMRVSEGFLSALSEEVSSR